MSVSVLGILGRSLGRVEACAASSRVSRRFVTLQMLVTGLGALKADGFSLRFFQSHSIFPSCWIEHESKHSKWCVAERNLNFQAPWRGRSVEAGTVLFCSTELCCPFLKLKCQPAFC